MTRPDGQKGLWEIGPLKGRKYRAGQKHGEDGRDWLPIDDAGLVVHAPTMSDDQLKAADAAEEAVKRAKRVAVRKELSRLIGSATAEEKADSKLVAHDYLMGRGVDAEWLPGGVSAESMEPWIFSRKAPQWWPWSGENKEPPREDHKPKSRATALVAPVWALWSGEPAWDQFRGAHATYLVQDQASGRWKKRPEIGADGKSRPARIMHADCGGVVVLPGVDNWRKRPAAECYPHGVLLIGEGIETTRAGQAAVHMALTGGEGGPTGVTAWAALDAGNLLDVRIPVDVRRVIHTVIVLGDLDKPLDRRGRPSKTGQIKAAKAVLKLRELYPELTIVARFPSSKWFSDLVKMAEPGEDDRKGTRKGWIERFWKACGSTHAHEDSPIDVDRGCDWDDVLQVRGEPAEVGRAILDGLNLEANAERAAKGGSGVVGGGETQAAGSSFTPPADQDANSGPGEIGEDGDGGGGGEPPNYWGLLNWFHEGDDETRPKRPVVAKDVLVRARLFLLQRAWRKGDRRWRLAYWAGKWWWFDRGVYEDLPEIELKHRVAVWLRQLYEVKPKTSHQFQRINPGRSTVADICEKLAGECAVRVMMMPAWLPATLDEEGKPYFATGAEIPPRLALYDDHRGRADRWFVDEGGMFPLAELVEVRKGQRSAIDRRPHVPELFTAWRRPYTLDLVELAASVRDPEGWTEARTERHMPMFGRVLKDMTETVEPQLAPERLLQLGMMIGDSLSGDRRLEHVPLVGGPTRSGKTLLEGMLVALHGQPPITAATSFTALGSGFGLSDLVGKPLVIISDGEIGRYTDTGVSVEMIKTISGNGMVRVEPKYGDAVTLRLNPRLWIFVNADPGKLQDSSGALSGRWCVWPMNVSFYGKEDPTLKERVISEAPGVAVWAMHHYALLASMEHPRIPQGELAREALAGLLAQQSPIWPFVVDCLQTETNEHAPGGCVVKVAKATDSIPFSVMYWVYKHWCRSRSKPAVGQNKFSGQIRMYAPWVRERQLDMHARKMALVGIALRDDVPAAWKNEFVEKAEPKGKGYGPSPDDPEVYQQLGLPV